MDINPSYNCLLGRPWIHDAGAVTTTLHQKLKFIWNGKLAIVSGEQVLMISQLSAFRYIDIEEDVVITQFQRLEIANAVRIKDLDEEDKVGTSMASFKDAQQVVASGQASGWGKIMQLSDNKDRSWLAFNPYEQSAKAPMTIQKVKLISEIFRSGGFMNQSCAILQDDVDEGPSFVTRGGSSHRTPIWMSVDIPEVMHVSE